MKIDNKLILENSKDLNILYIEDDALLRESTLQLFLNYFKSVDTAVDGEDGYNRYKSFLDETQSSYDLVISDINMPNVDGLEMCKKIKEINYEQAIIFVTAFNEISYLHSAIHLGVNAFLIKPIEVEQLKSVLYTTTQTIADRKLVLSHYQQIEDRNMLTINQKDARNLNRAKDIVDDLEKRKEEISYQWVENSIVQERLQRHTIDVEYFRTHYAIKVIEYFFNVINGDAEIGNCPIVLVMIDFFKHKDLPLSDIFIICAYFKNTITAYISIRYSFNHKLFDDISLILDRNFEGVIINYLKMKGIETKVFSIVTPVTQPKLEVEEELETIEEINYTEYVIEHDIYELNDLEQDIDSLAISVTMSSSVTVEDSILLGSKIKRYGNILSNYPLFSQLGVYIVKLGINLSDNAQLLFDDKDRMSNITALIEGFVNDLIVWRKEIFENNIEDPHFLNSSFFSNVDTIIMFIEYDESAQVDADDGDMEFF